MIRSCCAGVFVLFGLVHADAAAQVRLDRAPARLVLAQTSIGSQNGPLRCRDRDPLDGDSRGFGPIDAVCARQAVNPGATCVLSSDALAEATLSGSQQDVRSITLRVNCGATTSSDPDQVVFNDPNSPTSCSTLGSCQGFASASFSVDVLSRTRVRITVSPDLSNNQSAGQAQVTANNSVTGSGGIFIASEVGVAADTLVRDMIIEAADDDFDDFGIEVRAQANTSSSIQFPDGVASAAATVTVTFEPAEQEEGVIRWAFPGVGGLYDLDLNWDPQQVPEHSNARSDTVLFEGSPELGPIGIVANEATAGRMLINGMQLDLNGSVGVFGDLQGPELEVSGDGSLILDAAEGPSALETPSASIADGQLRINAQAGPARLEVKGPMIVDASELNEVLVENGGELKTAALSIGGFQQRPGTADVTIRGVGNNGLPSSLTVSSPGNDGGGTTIVGGPFAPGQLILQSGATAELFNGLAVGAGFFGLLLLNNAGAPAGLQTELDVSGETQVGAGGPGIIQLEGGARMINTGNLKIGVGPGAPSGLVSLSDGSFLNVIGTLSVGVAGQGVLNVLTANAVQCDTLVVGGTTAQANGTVTLQESGTFLTVRQNAQVGVSTGAGSVTVGTDSVIVLDGTMTIGGGSGTGNVALVDARIQGTGNIVVSQNGTLAGTGTVSVPKTKVFSTNAFISPGLSPGTLTIDGDYEHEEGGVLVIEVAGLEPGQFDVLHVTGDATLAGQVDLRFIDGFVPSPGDTIDFVVVDGEITGILTGELVVPAGGGGGGAGGGGDGVGNANANDNMTEPNDNDVAENINDNAANANGNDNTGEVNDNADPIDEQPAEPTEDVEVRWEVTPESTCRVTIIEVTPRPTQDGDGVRPPARSGGICGAGLGLVLPPLVVSLAFVRRRCNERDCAP